MTDKQIIGGRGSAKPYTTLNTMVVMLENKQLKSELQAKEQECEELKKQHQGDKGLITATGKMNYQLLQEYDQLKAENEELREEAAKYRIEAFKQGQLALKDLDRSYKLKQTLAEIKDIVLNGKSFAERYMITGEQKANVLTYANAILQKISECEVNND